MIVAGVDTSTQSCKVVIRNAASGALLRFGSARHPDGSEVSPQVWWDAFNLAVTKAGGLRDVAALAVGGQQHGLVALDADGEVVRPALLWNDTRSAGAARELVAEFGGAAAWARAIGSVPVASLTVTKLRWLRNAEPRNAARVAAVALPHDWLTWRIAGYGPRSAGLEPDLDALVTDRSDASGTGYFDSAVGTLGEYRPDLVAIALGRSDVVLPRVLGPTEMAGRTADGMILGPGAGDNAAAALGLGWAAGDVGISIGTSGVVSAVTVERPADASGLVTGFADAMGGHLAMAVTLNASRVLDAARALLGVDHETLSRLALAAPAGADGLTLLPYLEGERTPDRPGATGSLHGIRLGNLAPDRVARAFVEGMLCGLADGLDAVRDQGVPAQRLVLIGGGARSAAVRQIAPSIFGLPVSVPEPGEYVADGAARQAAWILEGSPTPPRWPGPSSTSYDGDPEPTVRQRYAAVRG